MQRLNRPLSHVSFLCGLFLIAVVTASVSGQDAPITGPKSQEKKDPSVQPPASQEKEAGKQEEDQSEPPKNEKDSSQEKVDLGKGGDADQNAKPTDAEKAKSADQEGEKPAENPKPEGLKQDTSDDKSAKQPSTQDPKTQDPKTLPPETTGDSSTQPSIQTNKYNDEENRPAFNTGKLKFTFRRTEWSKVIQWFADEAKLDLNMPVTPEGSFSYSSNGEFTLLEAMDVINSFLIREQNYVLIRHANLIFVHDLGIAVPPTMIETISPEKLDTIGQYELARTEFDLSDVDIDSFSRDAEGLVREETAGKIRVLSSSNRMFVQATGGRLRTIRKFLEIAKEIAGNKEESVSILELEFITPEEVMTVAAELMPLDEENYFEDNDSGERLKVVIQAFGNRFILKGTSKSIKRFGELVTLLDKKPDATAETTMLAKPEPRRYPLASDRELILQVLRTMLAGTDGLRLALAEEAGEVIAYATPETHDLIQEIISSLQSDMSEFQVVRLNEYDADSMIEILNKGYGIVEGEQAPPNQPVFMADPVFSDQIIVKAKPSQLAAIKKLVESIDPLPGEGGNFEKNYIEFGDIRGKNANRAMDLIQENFNALGRPNKIRIYKSKAVQEGLNLIKRREEEKTDSSPKQDEKSGSENPKLPPGAIPLPEKKTEPENKATPESGTTTTSSNRFLPNRTYFLTRFALQDQEKDTTQEKPLVKPKEGEKLQSVPGAPILVRETGTGLIVMTDDLKALGEINELLKREFGPDGEGLAPDFPTIIELKHRKAIEMKDLLEMFLGVSSSDSGGGGGGGLGGLLGGMAQNAIGGVAGQMIGGMMGGGGGLTSDATTSDLLTGDVKIDADAVKNVLLVRANDNDLELIMEYIDYFDTDGPQHDPSLDGKTYAIEVNYRDAAELAEVIKTQLQDRIKSANGNASRQQNQQAQQLQMLQQLMGRGRGGRGGQSGGKSVEQSEPKMTVGVDTQMNSILVTGPEFLYLQVKAIVEALDTKSAIRNSSVVILGVKNNTPDAIKSAIESLQSVSGSNSRTTSSTTGSRPTPTTTGGNIPFNPAMFQNRLPGGIGGSPFSGNRGGSTGGAPSGRPSTRGSTRGSSRRGR